MCTKVGLGHKIHHHDEANNFILFYFVASQFGIEWDSNQSPCEPLLSHPKLLLFSATCRRAEWVITMKVVISLVSVSKPLITEITANAKYTVSVCLPE